MLITNSKVKGIVVDDVDADLNEWRWSLSMYGYPRRGAVGTAGIRREPKMHRVVAERMLGRHLAKGEEVDHRNGNPLDNRRSNLRVCSHRENMRNMQNRRRGRSNYIGVSKCYKTYRSYLVVDNQQIHVGMIPTPEEAAWMRDQWAIALHGEFARLNFEYLPVTKGVV